ncbi:MULTISPECIES: wax ester/triacylglycerol synthase domain-containing protein [Streptomyces]|uniref:O-acyltransferase WSD1-like N-terminal domain-containing protein n=1 Tax=Streptomyces morookaense TaxID=1970 RepID=A0A7Y7B204_STRMO|nr:MULTISPECIES: wax ester/triacylglycerol synthase domain-containing protein [Streptomyces]MCC2278073.1 hypothetical protein [Streptomyces sp. ET3-23]NVK77379.1 hypothetical protein [Streptomyces morookaense]GHF21391.1 diacylglycerol O-acyltransferase [Streptomyces morookaense]
MRPHAQPPALAATGAARQSAVDMPPLDAWLFRHQSSGAICMTAGLLAWFEGPPPTPAELRDRVRQRWAVHERLCLTGVDSPAWPQWTPGPAWDPAHHVAGHDTSPAALKTLAAQLLAHPLGPARPPWQLHLLPADGGFALFLLAHHALLDGVSLVTLLRALLDAPAAVPRPRSADGAAPLLPSRLDRLRAVADVLPRARPLPFHGPVDARRAVSWSRVPVSELSAARDALGSGRASANAVFLAAAAGALRTAGLTGRLSGLPGVCAMVPVDVRDGSGPVVLGNHYATVRVPLPAGGDARRRLAAVDGFTRRAALKQRAQAQARLVASRPRRHGRFDALLGRYADSPYFSSLLCTSAASYAGRLTLGPARFTALAGLPPLSPGHPLAVSMLLHDETAVVTVVTDHGHRHLAARLPGLIREEIDALRG